jgi:thiol:disulfide interchange protein DsbA
LNVTARAFYAAKKLGAAERIHRPLFNAIVVEHRQLQDVRALAEFVAMHGVDPSAFTKAFDSSAVSSQVKNAEARSRGYNLASVPEFAVNGKYRIDPMRAGGRVQMLEVVEFLIEKERGLTSR